ncbi:MAG: nitrous oxide reductase accessory protein NosL [Ferruginibacter sp.]
MKNNKISIVSRVLLFMCGLALLVVLFKPIWRIELQAPQYPEGLRMFIYANKLAGDVQIINGLNHYIGMKTLHSDDFAEFKILPAIIIGFSALFFLLGIIAKRKWVVVLFALFVAFGILAMIDFWRWEYDYGHNLNPAAAIIVPGMAYQPPLIGFKQLLNFGAYSTPAIGGWIFVAVGIFITGILLYEWKRNRQTYRPVAATGPLLLISFIVLLNSCSTQPTPINTGKDNCDFCKMTISDNRFGAEIVTKKMKVYKFDEGHCVISFLKTGKIKKGQIAGIYFTDFVSPHKLTDVNHAFFLQSASLKSPMNGNIAAFSNEDSVASVLTSFGGNKVSWSDVQK